MITIQFNGSTTSIVEGISLADFLAEKSYHGNAFAVAINECFVARSQYQNAILFAGDRIEIVAAMQGG